MHRLLQQTKARIYAALPQAVRDSYVRRELRRTFPGPERPVNQMFYVVTHERSGTHLCINTLLANTDLPKFYHTAPSRAWPYDSERSYRDIKAFREKWPTLWRQGSIVKSHATMELFSEWMPEAMVLYVVRNPFDCLLSFYSFLSANDYIWPNGDRFEYGSLSEFLERPINEHLRLNTSVTNTSPQTILDRFCTHVRGWVYADKPRMIVSYRQLLEKTDAAVKQICGKLGVDPHTDTVVPHIRDTPSVHAGRGRSGHGIARFSQMERGLVLDRIAEYGLTKVFSEKGEVLLDSTRECIVTESDTI